jgi:hypothetical protein
MRNFFFLIILLLPAAVPAQSSLHLSPGATFYIGGGTQVAVDSLVLTPSLNYTITGGNGLQRSATPLHNGSNPHISRVYQFTNTLAPFTGVVSIYYRDVELNGLGENLLALNVHNGSGWNAYITNVIRNNSSNFVTTTLSGIALNELTLGTAASGPLPMVWLNVYAQRRSGVIQISWQTADEDNCANYQVEKSSNGTDWAHLGNALKANNTTGPNNYSLNDNNLPTAINFYRVRQNDLDGKYTYSKTVSVKNDQSGGVWLYPIPAGNVLTVVAGGSLQLRSVNIYNTAGSLVAYAQPQRTASHTIDVQHLAAGTYSAVIILSDGTAIARNFIKR